MNVGLPGLSNKVIWEKSYFENKKVHNNWFDLQYWTVYDWLISIFF